MSRVEEALRRLRSAGTLPKSPAAGTARRSGAEPAVTVEVRQKRKSANDGARHEVSERALVAAGLLAPLAHSRRVADEFRRIKRPLIANATSDTSEHTGPMNVIMIASAMPGAGKTFCSVNLAVSIALERELNVLLVDADVAKPQISIEFGLGESPGLIDLLLDETSDLSELLVRTDLHDIQVLPAGRRHPQATELLASDRMSGIVSELAGRYPDRIVILDSPPLLLTSEAQALAGQVGQIALIVEAGKSSHQVVVQTIDTLDSDRAINLILNKSRHVGRTNHYRGDVNYYGYAEA